MLREKDIAFVPKSQVKLMLELREHGSPMSTIGLRAADVVALMVRGYVDVQSAHLIAKPLGSQWLAFNFPEVPVEERG